MTSPAPPARAHDRATEGPPEVVLVTGSGRSGTSSLAGTLKRLGLHVPAPEVPAKPSNPKGFYEPQWVIDFHKRHLQELALHNIDARPDAPRAVQRRLTDGAVREELSAWLAEQLPDAPLVIKDPHAFWFADLWKDVAREQGAGLRLLTALRHPAEVVGSRDIAYLSKQPESLRRIKETSNIAGWIHAAVLTERAGRDIPRAFLRYADLMTDWRAAIGRTADQLGIHLNADLDSGDHHDVDDFIDVKLQRSHVTWEDLTVPVWLREMGEEVWQLVSGLVEQPDDPAAEKRLDELHERYDLAFQEAVALSFDHTKAETTMAVREAVAERDQRIARLRRRVAGQRDRLEKLERRRPRALAAGMLGRGRRGFQRLRRPRPRPQ